MAGADTRSSIGRWRAQPAADRRLLLQAVVGLWMVRAGLRLAGVRSVHDRLTRWSGPDGPETADAAALAARLARIVESAARHAGRDHTCLHRSLVLWFLCRRHGVWARIALGAKRTAAGLEAHAWVEHRGVVINDAAGVQQEYAPLAWTATGRHV